MTRTGLIALLGAATLCAAPAYATELVTNGGFEANPADGSAITSWIVTGNGVFDDQVFPASGAHDVAFTSLTGDSDVGTLSQDLATTAGTSYKLSFQLLDTAGYFGDSFSVSFGGFSQTFSGSDAAFFYTPIVISVAGSAVTGAVTTLSFQGTADPTFGQAWNLDDVSVGGGVPEPGAWALMLSGFFGIGWALRRRPLTATC